MTARRSSSVSTAAVLRLLKSNDAEEMTAAAVLLGRLRPSDPKVLKALERELQKAPPHLKPYLLDALARFDGPESTKIILPFLLVHGTLREQAVQVLARKGPRVIRELRALRKDAAPEDVTTLIRVAGAIPGTVALDFLLDLLPTADFEHAKAIAGGLRAKADATPQADRRHVVRRLLAFLKVGRLSPNTTAEIAALKILGAYQDGQSFNAVLDRSGPAHPPIIRKNALDALLAMPLTARRRKKLLERLLPIVGESESPAITASALRVLREFDTPEVPAATWMTLARSPHQEIARVALAELKRFPKAEVLTTLYDALLCGNASIQEAAAATLGELPGAVDDLVAALIEGDPPPEVLSSRLLVLATLERSSLNRAIERRAREALERGDPAAARRLLEPLVRGRAADPQGRYLLALAHLLLSLDDSPEAHPDFERALHLLVPLTRLQDWLLSTHLPADPLLSQAHRATLARALATRPEIERALAALLHPPVPS